MVFTPEIRLNGGWCICSPAPILTWEKVNSSAPHHRRSMTNSNSQLLIGNVRRHIDEGAYMCTATNTEGLQTRIFWVDVQGLTLLLCIRTRYFAQSRSVKYWNKYVYLSVCLSVCSYYLKNHKTDFYHFFCTLLLVVVRFSSHRVVISYVRPGLCMTLHGADGPESSTTLNFDEVRHVAGSTSWTSDN